MTVLLLSLYIIPILTIRKQVQLIKKLVSYYEPSLRDFVCCAVPVVNIIYTVILLNLIIRILYYEKGGNKLRVFINKFFSS
jgi:hypothetical protein